MPDSARWRIERWLRQLSDLDPRAAEDRLSALCAEHPADAEALRVAWAQRPQARKPGDPARPSSAIGRLFTRAARPPVDLPRAAAPGQVIGGYRLIEPIGQGGMGQVWRAEQLSLGRTVALKLVRPDRVTPRTLEYFAREARAGGRLSHPGVVAVHGYGEDGGVAWIAMELIEGCWTLRDFLDDVAWYEEELSADYYRDVAVLVSEVADALQAAHDAGVIHRDIKPQNILVTRDERPKVTDFGLARIANESALSSTGDVAGTYWYMSPEQVRAARAGLDHRTDVFSLGVVLFELLTGRRPFEGDTASQVAEKILWEPPPVLRSLRSRIPVDLAVICGKCLEKDRDHRYADMAALAADLRRHLANEPISARPPSWSRKAALWMRRHPTKCVAAGMLLVGFIVVLALLSDNVAARRAATKSANAALDRAEEAEAVVAFIQAIFGRVSDSTVESTDLRVRDLVEVAATVAPPAGSSLAYMQTEELMASMLNAIGRFEQASERYENVAETMLALDERFRREQIVGAGKDDLRRSAYFMLSEAARVVMQRCWHRESPELLDRADELLRRAGSLEVELDEVERCDRQQLRATVAYLRGDDERARAHIVDLRPTLLRALESDDAALHRPAASGLISIAAMHIEWGEDAAALEWLDPVLEEQARSRLPPTLEVIALLNRVIASEEGAPQNELAHFAAELVALIDAKYAVENPYPIRILPGVWDTLVNVGLPMPAMTVAPLDRWHAAASRSTPAERAKFLGSLGIAALVSGDTELSLIVAAAMGELGDQLRPEDGPQLVLVVGGAFRALEDTGAYDRICEIFVSVQESLGALHGGDYETIRSLLLVKGAVALAHQGRTTELDPILLAHAIDLAAAEADAVETVFARVRAACRNDGQRTTLDALHERLATLGGR